MIAFDDRAKEAGDAAAIDHDEPLAGPARGLVAAQGGGVTAMLTAASLLLAGGAGVLASLLVTPVQSLARIAGLLLASAAAVGLGLLLLVGGPLALWAA